MISLVDSDCCSCKTRVGTSASWASNIWHEKWDVGICSRLTGPAYGKLILAYEFAASSPSHLQMSHVYSRVCSHSRLCKPPQMAIQRYENLIFAWNGHRHWLAERKGHTMKTLYELILVVKRPTTIDYHLTLGHIIVRSSVHQSNLQHSYGS